MLNTCAGRACCCSAQYACACVCLAGPRIPRLRLPDTLLHASAALAHISQKPESGSTKDKRYTRVLLLLSVVRRCSLFFTPGTQAPPIADPCSQEYRTEAFSHGCKPGPQQLHATNVFTNARRREKECFLLLSFISVIHYYLYSEQRTQSVLFQAFGNKCQIGHKKTDI